MTHNGSGAALVLDADVLAQLFARYEASQRRAVTGCVRWTGNTHPSGWPRMHTAGRSWSVAQVVWALAHRVVPRRVYRTCTTRDCCAIAHLTLTNPRRRPKPPTPQAKRLSQAELYALRDAYARGVEMARVARQLHVSAATASRAARRITYSEVA